MLISLPLIYFGLWLFNLAGWYAHADEKAMPWRGAFVRASLIWGATLVVLLEILSLFKSIASMPLSILWLLATCVTLFIGLKRGSLQRSIVRVKRELPLLKPGFLPIAGGSMLLLLLYIALKAPPNNVDSLLYHMPRVLHWAQDGSLAHYPTGYEHQLWNPIWAESAILNLRLLWGNDQLANLIQWFRYVGSNLVASAIASALGVEKRGQVIAAAFTASTPMAILQATSTQNDLVAGYWLLCLVYMMVTTRSRQALSLETSLYIGLATGLGMLTKGTFYPMAFPFLIWLVYWIWRQQGLGGFKKLVVMGLISAVLNLGFWLRNIVTYRTPLGPLDSIQNRMGSVFHVGEIIINLLKNVLLNFATPWNGINQTIVRGVRQLEHYIGNPDGSAFDLLWFWNYEDLAGSPLQLLLILGSGLLFILYLRRLDISFKREYIALCLASFISFSMFIADDLFNVRLQLGGVLLWAPVVGMVFSQLKFRLPGGLLTYVLVLSMVPWVILNKTRPIVGVGDDYEGLSLPMFDILGRTRVGSILFVDRMDILYANFASRQDEHEILAADLVDSGCTVVGLRIDSHDPEYLFWDILGAPQSGYTLRSVLFDEGLERYIQDDFKPCAIICTVCANRDELFGLDFHGRYGDAELFLDNP
jgi:hypothetical protein